VAVAIQPAAEFLDRFDVLHRQMLLEKNHGTDALTFVHQVKSGVDLFQRHRVCHHAIQFDLAIEVVFHVAGQLGAALDPAERGAFPGAAGDQLERAGADFLTGAGYADDGGHAPTHVATLQRLAHDVDVADALEGIIDAAVGHLLDRLNQIAAEVLGRIESIGRAQGGRHGKFVGVEVDGDDSPGLGHHRALNHRQTDAAEAEYRDRRTWLDLGRIQHCADAGGDAATEQAHFVQRRGGIDLGQRDFRHHGVFGEGRATHVVKQRLTLAGKAAGVVGHVTGPHRGGDGLAQVGFRRTAIFAFAAFRDVERNDMIAGFQPLTPGPHSTTSQPPSWPRMQGKAPSGSSPDRVKASVWQTPWPPL
jgi:hypothetical protein